MVEFEARLDLGVDTSSCLMWLAMLPMAISPPHSTGMLIVIVCTCFDVLFCTRSLFVINVILVKCNFMISMRNYSFFIIPFLP